MFAQDTLPELLWLRAIAPELQQVPWLAGETTSTDAAGELL
jgi:hypothetical protein